MNLDHIRALAKDGMSRHLNHNGLDLWTNGHILIPAKVEGSKELDSIAKVWDEVCGRIDVPVTASGPIHGGGPNEGHSRQLSSDPSLSVFINETYRSILSADGAEPYLFGREKPIAFRKHGVLVGLCMPMKAQFGKVATEDPTEAQLFEVFACAENDWYLQGSTMIRRELAKIQADIETLGERVEDLEVEIRAKELQADGLRKRIAEAKKAEAVTA